MKFVLGLPQFPDSVLRDIPEPCALSLKRLSDASFADPELTFPPNTKFAAVLVLLYVSPTSNNIRALVTTRSKHLRTHAGQSAFPGGRVDDTDASFLDAALREAHEEVHLPLNHPAIHPLSLVEPFLSAHGLVVAPVVAYLSDPSVILLLKAHDAEVSHIFSHPLEAVLDPSLMESEPLAEAGTEDWKYPEPLHNVSDHILETLGSIPYRMHRFRSAASPIKGLTADIMIKIAEVAFNKEPIYDRFQLGQRYGAQEVHAVVHFIHDHRLNNR